MSKFKLYLNESAFKKIFFNEKQGFLGLSKTVNKFI